MLEKIPGPLFVEREFTVKTYDIDFANHVSNIVYIRWLEDLRLAILEEYFPLEESMSAGIAPVLTRTEIEYASAVRLFEPVRGRMWAGDVGRVRIKLHAEILAGDRVCARARQQGVFINLESHRPLPIPEQLRTIYRAQRMMLAQ